jgi:hypothetical protein
MLGLMSLSFGTLARPERSQPWQAWPSHMLGVGSRANLRRIFKPRGSANVASGLDTPALDTKTIGPQRHLGARLVRGMRRENGRSRAARPLGYKAQRPQMDVTSPQHVDLLDEEQPSPGGSPGLRPARSAHRPRRAELRARAVVSGPARRSAVVAARSVADPAHAAY